MSTHATGIISACSLSLGVNYPCVEPGTIGLLINIRRMGEWAPARITAVSLKRNSSRFDTVA